MNANLYQIEDAPSVLSREERARLRGLWQLDGTPALTPALRQEMRRLESRIRSLPAVGALALDSCGGRVSALRPRPSKSAAGRV